MNFPKYLLSFVAIFTLFLVYTRYLLNEKIVCLLIHIELFFYFKLWYEFKSHNSFLWIIKNCIKWLSLMNKLLKFSFRKMTLLKCIYSFLIFTFNIMTLKSGGLSFIWIYLKVRLHFLKDVGSWVQKSFNFIFFSKVFFF